MEMAGIFFFGGGGRGGELQNVIYFTLENE